MARVRKSLQVLVGTVLIDLPGVRSLSGGMQIEQADVTTKGDAWRELLPSVGVISSNIKASGVMVDAPALAYVMAAAMDEGNIIARFLANDVPEIEGGQLFKVTSLERAGDYNTAETWGITAELVDVAESVIPPPPLPDGVLASWDFTTASSDVVQDERGTYGDLVARPGSWNYATPGYGGLPAITITPFASNVLYSGPGFIAQGMPASSSVIYQYWIFVAHNFQGKWAGSGGRIMASIASPGNYYAGLFSAGSTSPINKGGLPGEAFHHNGVTTVNNQNAGALFLNFGNKSGIFWAKCSMNTVVPQQYRTILHGCTGQISQIIMTANNTTDRDAAIAYLTAKFA